MVRSSQAPLSLAKQAMAASLLVRDTFDDVQGPQLVMELHTQFADDAAVQVCGRVSCASLASSSAGAGARRQPKRVCRARSWSWSCTGSLQTMRLCHQRTSSPPSKNTWYRERKSRTRRHACHCHGQHHHYHPHPHHNHHHHHHAVPHHRWSLQRWRSARASRRSRTRRR